jgi:hypothetical protein
MANISRILKRFEIDFMNRISVELRQAFAAAVEAEVKNDPMPSMERPKCSNCGADMAAEGTVLEKRKSLIVERTGRGSRTGSSGSLESNGDLDDFEMK